MERFVKNNPTSGFGKRTLTIVYANVGREQEARSMLNKATEGYPPTMKNVRFMMSMYPLKDLQLMERIAASYIKAGLPGEPTGFYKISKENRLTENEIRKLVELPDGETFEGIRDRSILELFYGCGLRLSE